MFIIEHPTLKYQYRALGESRKYHELNESFSHIPLSPLTLQQTLMQSCIVVKSRQQYECTRVCVCVQEVRYVAI